MFSLISETPADFQLTPSAFLSPLIPLNMIVWRRFVEDVEPIFEERTLPKVIRLDILECMTRFSLFPGCKIWRIKFRFFLHFGGCFDLAL